MVKSQGFLDCKKNVTREEIERFFFPKFFFKFVYCLTELDQPTLQCHSDLPVSRPDLKAASRSDRTQAPTNSTQGDESSGSQKTNTGKHGSEESPWCQISYPASVSR